MLDGALRRKYQVLAASLALFLLAIFGMRFVQQQFFPSSDRRELIVDWTVPPAR